MSVSLQESPSINRATHEKRKRIAVPNSEENPRLGGRQVRHKGNNDQEVVQQFAFLESPLRLLPDTSQRTPLNILLAPLTSTSERENLLNVSPLSFLGTPPKAFHATTTNQVAIQKGIASADRLFPVSPFPRNGTFQATRERTLNTEDAQLPPPLIFQSTAKPVLIEVAEDQLILPHLKEFITERYANFINRYPYVHLEDLSGMRSGQLALTMLATNLYEEEGIRNYISEGDRASTFNTRFPYPTGLIEFGRTALGLSNLTPVLYDSAASEECLLRDLADGPALVCRMQEDTDECREWILITPIEEEFLVQQPNHHGCADFVTADQLKAVFRGEKMTVIRYKPVNRRLLL